MIRLKIGQLNLSSQALKYILIGCFINGIELGLICTTALLENTRWGVYLILVLLFLPWSFLGPKLWNEMEEQGNR